MTSTEGFLSTKQKLLSTRQLTVSAGTKLWKLRNAVPGVDVQAAVDGAGEGTVDDQREDDEPRHLDHDDVPQLPRLGAVARHVVDVPLLLAALRQEGFLVQEFQPLPARIGTRQAIDDDQSL